MTPTIVRAAVLREAGQPLQIEEVQLDAPRRREVLVRVRAAGVCHSDAHFQAGRRGTPLPTVLGHEVSGVVEAVGEDVTYLAPGDHVVGCLTPFCGNCVHCLGGRMHLCRKEGLTRAADDVPRISSADGTGGAINQFVHLSAFAEAMLVHENALVKVDERVPFDRAALIGCAVTTGLGAVFNTAQVRPGDVVAVVGAGGIGLNVVQGARIAGAARIIVVDTLADKLELAREFGATDTVLASEDAVSQVLEMTGGGVDHAFEAVGHRATAESAFAMVAPGGVATIVGMLPAGEQISIPAQSLSYDRRIQGSNMGSNVFRVDVPRYVDFYLDGRLKLDELITARVSLDEVNEALETLGAPGVARTVVVFDEH